MSTDEEGKIAFVKQATSQMGLATFDVICSVMSAESTDRGRFVGTGFRLGRGKQRWLVTANHVFEEATRTGRLVITRKRGEPPVELTAPPLVNATDDVAALLLPPEFGDVEAWPFDRIDSSSESLRHDFLFTHGFPARATHFSPSLQAMMAKSLPYGAMMREDELPNDLTSAQFALDFNPTNVEGLAGDAAAWQLPHGLSGSPVWRIGAAGKRAQEWDPSCARLVGLLTQWRPKDHLLTALRADVLKELLA